MLCVVSLTEPSDFIGRWGCTRRVLPILPPRTPQPLSPEIPSMP